MIYCLVPRELAEKLHEPLRRHFADRADVEVIVEARRRERRTVEDRRAGDGDPPPTGERRRVLNAAGRRAGERRATLVPAAEAPELPRRARRHADDVAFLERLEPSGEQAEDRDTAHLVNRFQSGDRDAYAEIYMRYFDRVYAYMRVMLKNRHEAEDATQEIFVRVFDKLPEQRLHRPFRAWLMTVVRNHAIDVLRRSQRVELRDEVELDPRANGALDSEEMPESLDWIADRDLLVLFERLPLAQRQVLLLRFLLDLSAAETAAILDRTAEDVRALQYRALKFIRTRLAAAGREGPSRQRARARTYTKQALVLRKRRFALVKR